MSVAIPFGAFETLLSEPANKVCSLPGSQVLFKVFHYFTLLSVSLQDIVNKVSYSYKLVQSGDLSKLQTIKEAILQMRVSPSLVSFDHLI